MEIVYHANCADGIVARELLSIFFQSTSPKFEESIITVPYNYENNFGHLENAIWVDCSPGTWEEFEFGLKNKCVYLDHHGTRKEFFDKANDLGYKNIFFGSNDNHESGAWLVYQTYLLYNPNIKAEDLAIYREIARLISIGDTFFKNVPEKDFELARGLGGLIQSIGDQLTFKNIDEINYLIQLANGYKEKRQKRAKRLADQAILIKINNLKVAFINHSEISDASAILRNQSKADLIIGYTIRAENNQMFAGLSLRSSDTFDCSALAAKFGGGGHKNAAGAFNYKIKDELVMDSLIKDIYNHLCSLQA